MLVLAMLVTCVGVPIYSDAKSGITKETVKASGVIPEWAKWVAQALWYVIDIKSTQLYKIYPSTSATANQITINTGSIYYNNGNYGGQANTTIQVDSSKSGLNVDVSLLPTTAMTGIVMGKKLVLTMQKSGSSNYVINKTTVGNSITVANFSNNTQRGNYYITMSTTESAKWNLRIIVFDNNVGGGGGEVQSYQNNEGIYKVYDLNGTEMYVTEEGFVLPSDARLSVSGIKGDDPLTMNEIVSQFYDDGLSMGVYNLKDYNVGDNIIMKDTITNLSYNSEKDFTYFTFSTSDGDVDWKFAGDLTGQYHVGDEIKLKLKVAEMCKSSDIQFEILDYTNVVINDEVPKLSDYAINE